MFVGKGLQELTEQDPEVSAVTCRTYVTGNPRLAAYLAKIPSPGLIQERKVADMVNEDVSKNGKIRVYWCYLTIF
jgi:hypothetical protein